MPVPSGPVSNLSGLGYSTAGLPLQNRGPSTWKGLSRRREAGVIDVPLHTLRI